MCQRQLNYACFVHDCVKLGKHRKCQIKIERRKKKYTNDVYQWFVIKSGVFVVCLEYSGKSSFNTCVFWERETQYDGKLTFLRCIYSDTLSTSLNLFVWKSVEILRRLGRNKLMPMMDKNRVECYRLLALSFDIIVMRCMW